MREPEPGEWEFIVEAGRDPISGKERQVSRTFRGNMRDAKKLRDAKKAVVRHIPALFVAWRFVHLERHTEPPVPTRSDSGSSKSCRIRIAGSPQVPRT
jgi:hypothetical protein